ncbi:MAG: OsmC family protein [Acidobacteriia bacterium]|nr:OsmC family protein [Terriglobia bacterium]
MPTNYSYRTTAHWTEHTRGIVEAEGIPRTINFAAPPEFGGEPGLWTPEHLLVAAVSTCYVATLRAVAEASKLQLHALELTVEGTLEKQEGGFRFTRVLLLPTVTIAKEEERERMGRLLEKAERACLITRSLACTAVLEAKILVQEVAHV